ncbi:Transposon TX1 uncharacterized 149 kDa protein, partial [Linum perenne]
FWESHPSYNSILCEAWKTRDVVVDLCSVSKRLRGLKKGLKALNNTNFSRISDRVKVGRENLEVVQAAALANPSEMTFKAMHSATFIFEGLKLAEETFFHQKSRVDWLSQGDSNTRFFHSYVKARQAKNTIRKIVDDGGIEHTDVDGISKTIINFYKGLLDTINPDVLPKDAFFYRELLVNKVPAVNSLCEFPTADEIRNVLFSMPKGKARGPDGYSAEFFVKSWNVMGKDIVLAITHFFKTREMLSEVNSAVLTLIPKIHGADRMKAFRPITLCNVLYKGISKLLANRLKDVLPVLISKNQSSFIKDRLIGDNIMLAHELVRGYNKTRISPRAMVKIDWMKAFDSVDWIFLLTVMEAMEFPTIFIHWIKICLQTAKLGVNVNGGMCGYFKENKGVRQGDPLSSYLFVISMEVLTCMINRDMHSKTLPFIPNVNSNE